MTGSMAMVAPPPRIGADKAEAERPRDEYLFAAGIEVPAIAWRDRSWQRLPAQVYNEREDFERLAAEIPA